MKELRYTLLSDGSSDKVLIPILTWLLRQHQVACPIQPEWADLRRVNRAQKSSLADKIKTSLELYPCDLLFVHRDAEKEPHPVRITEIREAIEAAQMSLPAVCIVPVRMQEAWLLFDEAALRRAAGNPNGQQPLELPSLDTVESLPDPKDILHTLLREASGLSGRRRKKFNVNRAVHRVPDFIDDFAPLWLLSAFQALETEIKTTVQKYGWQLEGDQP